MAKAPTARLTRTRQIRVDDEFEQAVDELRRLSTPVATVSEVIRQAVFEALERGRAAGRRRK
jgi:Arc/MetJ family transcription regulator